MTQKRSNMENLEKKKPGGLGIPGTASAQLAIRANNMKPRVKVELKVGRSMMDWIRYSNTAKDLAGNGGKMLGITNDELSKHDKMDDAWTCIRGYVYNITPYMEYHPGGSDELIRGAGKDGTSLFDEYHRWVNIDSMLAKCLIGKMISGINSSPSKKSQNSSSSEESFFAKPMLRPSSDSRLSTFDSPNPKFDWHQRDDRVTIVVYSKSLAVIKENIIIHLIDGNLLLKTIIKDHVYKVNLKFAHEVLPLHDIAIDKSGKIEVAFLKCDEEKWKTIGNFLAEHGSYKKLSDCEPEYSKMRIELVQKVSHDTNLYCINIPDGSRLCIPLGYHVYLKANIEGMDVSRPYTVALPSLSMHYVPDDVLNGEKIYLLIKIYKNGVFTPLLEDISNGIDILVSDYEGNFNLNKLNECTDLILFAAGTGFTPMVRLIHKVLKCDKDSQRKVKLMFFNKTEEDILWKDQLDQLVNEHDEFSYINILSQPNEQWSGLTGRIQKDIITNFILKKQPEKKYLLGACGPTLFTEEAVRLTKELGFDESKIHAFLA